MKIVGVSACITGVAHTYMAQEAIEQECKKRGFEVKVETQGGLGIENELTEDEVTVKLLGGDLEIQWDQEKNTVYMTGPATVVFDGELK